MKKVILILICILAVLLPVISQEALTVSENGNVGINNIDPDERLDVNGNAIISGTLTAATMVINGNALIGENLEVDVINTGGANPLDINADVVTDSISTEALSVSGNTQLNTLEVDDINTSGTLDIDGNIITDNITAGDITVTTINAKEKITAAALEVMGNTRLDTLDIDTINPTATLNINGDLSAENLITDDVNTATLTVTGNTQLNMDLTVNGGLEVNRIIDVSPTDPLVIDGNVMITETLSNQAGNTYDALPIGTIIMYAGKNWAEDSTLPGWLSCTSGNSNITVGTIQIPNLEGSFIRGGDNSSATGKGGADSTKLSVDNLPGHNHSINHAHSGTTNETGSHSHTMTSVVSLTGDTTDGNGGDGKSNSVSTTSSAGNHVHTVEIPESTGLNSGVAGHEEPLSVSILPTYYTVIYIIKVAQGQYY